MRAELLEFLRETPLLDYSAKPIEKLIENRGWKMLDEFHRIQKISDFVRNEILFGYNVRDDLPASRVLSDGYGQCNTKGTLFMALLRADGIPCRLHGFTIDKKLQKGAMTGIVYEKAPREILHSWVEVCFGGKWTELEAFILDEKYLGSLQKKFPDAGAFCGYGAAVKDLQTPAVEWAGEGTYIQSEGIVRDLGIYSSPDEFYRAHGQDLSGAAAFFYRHVGRRLMNANVKRIRRRG